MSRRRRFGIVTAAVLGLLLALGAAPGRAQERSWENALEEKVGETPKLVEVGGEIYRQACFYCHGEAGDGQGAGERYLRTKPRVFTDGKYKVRTTPSGSLPTDEDLFRSITVGFPAYGMPSFGHLTAAERWALVYHLKTLAPRFSDEQPDPVVDIGEELAATPERVAEGEQVYEHVGCWRCHGKEGWGDGPSASQLTDSWENPIWVIAFAAGERYFKRGAGARDIVSTFVTGMNGTPMPSFSDAMTREETWALAHYIETLVPRGEKDWR